MNFNELSALLAHPDSEVRRYAPDKFAKYVVLEGLPLLINTLHNDPVEIVRIEAAECLGKLGEKSSIPDLELAYTKGTEELRRTIIWSLGQIGQSNQTSITALRDKSPLVRRWAVKSLQRINMKVDFEQFQEDYNELYSGSVELAEFVRSLQTENFNYWHKQLLKHLDNEPITIDAIISFLYRTKFINKNKKLDFAPLLNTGRREIYYPSLFRLMLACGEELPITSTDSIDALASSSDPSHHAVVRSLLDDSQHRTDAMRSMTKYYRDSYRDISLPDHRVDDLTTKLLLLELKILAGADFSLLLEMYNEGKGMGTLLRLMGNFNESVPYLKEHALNSKKSKRQAAIRALISLYERNKSEEVKDLLVKISKTERVWHLRRDIRIILNKNGE